MTPAIPEVESLPLEEKAKRFVDSVFGGEHRLKSFEDRGRYFELVPNSNTEFATFDACQLTKIVLAAHVLCVRASVKNYGMRGLKVWLHNRTCRSGSLYERHPDLSELLRGVE